MAFSAITGDYCFNASATADQASLTATVSLVTQPNAFQAGQIGVIIVACDNNQTTDGDEGAVTSVTDSKGHTWVKAAEFCNGQGAAKAGATCSIWWTTITTSYTTGAATITVNFSNATSTDATAVTGKSFSFDSSGTVAVEGTPATLATDAGDPGSLNVTTANITCLRIRGIAGETSNTSQMTNTTNWNLFTNTGTASGGSAANQQVRGEYRIVSGTGDASDPTWTSADHASVYVAFKEVAALARVPKSIPMTFQPYLAQ